MTDFKARLAEKRAQAELERQLKKVSKDSSPNLNPIQWTGRDKKEEKPALPDLAELDLPAADRLKLARLVAQHASLTAEISKLTKTKKTVTEDIKPLCKSYGLDKFASEGTPASYYMTRRSTISKELLLSQSVSPEVIAKATVTTESWSFRSSGSREEDD